MYGNCERCEVVFEKGKTQNAKTVGMVLPSCQESELFEVDELVYVGDEYEDKTCVNDCSGVVDVIVWVGGINTKEDWLKLSNSFNVKMLTVSDSMTDWTSPSSKIQLDSMVDKIIR